MNRKKRRRRDIFFLFNDILLLCRKEGPGRYFLRIYITLRAQGVSIEEIDGSDYPLRLSTRNKNFILYLQNEENRILWRNEFDASINGTHPEELKKNKTPDTIGDVQTFKTEVTNVTKEIEQILTPPSTSKNQAVVKTFEDSSDGASSDSPVQKKKSHKKNRKNRRTMEPQVGDLLGLGPDFYKLNLGPTTPIHNRSPSNGSSIQNVQPLQTPSIGPALQPSIVLPMQTPMGLSMQTPIVQPVQAPLGQSIQSPLNPFNANPTIPQAVFPRSGISPLVVSPRNPTTLVNPFLTGPTSAVTPLKNPFL